MRPMTLKHFFKNLGTQIKPLPPLLCVKLVSAMEHSFLMIESNGEWSDEDSQRND